MSRREIKACDTVDPETGICNREATGTCPLCEKDACGPHMGPGYAAIHVGIGSGGAPLVHKAGWIDVQPCGACFRILQRAFTAGRVMQSILPPLSVFVEALRALLATETMRGKK